MDVDKPSYIMAVLVHLEHNGIPLTLPLDTVEVAKVWEGLTWYPHTSKHCWWRMNK